MIDFINDNCEDCPVLNDNICPHLLQYRTVWMELKALADKYKLLGYYDIDIILKCKKREKEDDYGR